MKRAPAAAISDAVLYEGYLLYPYRPSAIKNMYRWTFGCLFPPAWCRRDPSDKERLHAEFLVAVTRQAEIDLRLRCLLLPRCDQDVGHGEPVQREMILDSIRPGACINNELVDSFSIAAGESLVSGEIGDADLIHGQVTIGCVEVDHDAVRMSVDVRNVTECGDRDVESRDGAAQRALLSAQLLLACRDAEFISLTDPPEHLRTAADACRNEGCWPVLAGMPGTGHQLLVAPIILEDYPQVAPHSCGELFDGTEIDELLTMRIRTLTDGEKAELADADRQARELLRRSEAMENEDLSRLHGVMQSVPAPSSRQAAAARLPQCLRVNGVELRPGDRVRLRPRSGTAVRRNDVFDLALQGQTATIETIERDFGDQLYFTVTVDCDPGRDLGQQGLPGHRFYFRPDEVQPLSQERSAQR